MSDQQIQKVKVHRLARVGLWVSDVTAQARFYCQVLGFDFRATLDMEDEQELENTEASVFLGLGDETYCLGLYNDNRPVSTNSRRLAPRSSLHHLTFEVDTAAELAALAARLKLSGIDFSLGDGEEIPGLTSMSASLWFHDPDGNRIEIAVAPEDVLTPHTAPAHRRSAPRPAALQHIALYTPHLDTMVDFYTEALGFDISDWLLRERAWLRCNTNHHTLLLIQGPSNIEHLGLQSSGGSELLQWGDYLAQRQVPLIWGPGRHGAGNDLFIRFADSEGFHVELSADMQQYYDRDVTIPPRLWHTRATALNLWGTMPSWLKKETSV